MSESKIYTVRLHGSKVKDFTSKSEAQAFMLDFVLMQNEYVKQLDYLDEAVLQSDLSASKEVLKYIMEKND
jgi:hypothetical protein